MAPSILENVFIIELGRAAGGPSMLSLRLPANDRAPGNVDYGVRCQFPPKEEEDLAMPEVNYFWDEIEDNVVREYDENNNTIVNYTTEPTRYGAVLTQDRNGEKRHYHYDGLGNVSELTDDAGDVTDAMRYTAFGEIASDYGTSVYPFRFQGRYGYYNMAEMPTAAIVRRRWLALGSGRWLSQDPLLLDKFNRYVYVSNSPAVFSDPSGLWKICCEFTFTFSGPNMKLLRFPPRPIRRYKENWILISRNKRNQFFLLAVQISLSTTNSGQRVRTAKLLTLPRIHSPVDSVKPNSMAIASFDSTNSPAHSLRTERVD